MKNKYPCVVLGIVLCACYLVGTTMPACAQTTIYQESCLTFPGGLPPGWTQTGAGWFPDDSLPSISGPAQIDCDGGGSFLRYHSSGQVSGQLRGPVVPLAVSAGAQVHLEFCLTNPGLVIGEGDGVSLLISADAGTTWVTQITDTAYHGSWTTISVLIPDSFLTSHFQFRFDGIGSQALIDVGIDNIRIVDHSPVCQADTSSVSGLTQHYVCKDQYADPIYLSTTHPGTASYRYLLTDNQDRLVQLIQGTVFDVNFLLPDQYRIYGLSYEGALIAPVNIPVSAVSATGCSKLSGNFLAFEVTHLQGHTTIDSDYNGYNVSIAGEKDGIATVSISGGKGVYSYLWQNDPATNDSTSQSLPAGNQTVFVTDSLTGCVYSDTVWLTEPMPLVPLLVLQSDYSGASIRCHDTSDGELGLSISGGVPPYQIAWGHDPGNDSLMAMALAAGRYEVRVTDSNGAIQVDSLSILAPDRLRIEVSRRKPACSGIDDGFLELNQQGGTGMGQWEWTDGALTSYRSGLAPGGYRVSLTDVNGCTTTDSLTVGEADVPLVVPVVTQSSCFGLADAEIELDILAGIPPLKHSWLSGDTGRIRRELIPGIYLAYSTDANGCVDTNEVRIKSPSPLRSSVATVPDGGSGTGAATIVVSGGLAPYQALWPSGDRSLSTMNLFSGAYDITVEDANGCQTTVIFSIDLAEVPDCLAPDLGFSPNGDGINDLWEIPCLEQYQNLEIQVVNRWGQRVFYALTDDRPWDGRYQGADLPNGTYYYVVSLNNGGHPAQFKGTLSIVR